MSFSFYTRPFLATTVVLKTILFPSTTNNPDNKGEGL